EQHRFGVEQRKMLLKNTSPQPSPCKGEGERLVPHLLSMTATPIPRSLALALYGDLELSVLNEMPKDRKKIITKVVPEIKRTAAYEFIRAQVKAGRQVFVICPLIDPSDKLGVKSVENEYQKLSKIIFSDLTIGKLHGKMKPAAKEKIMSAFAEASAGKAKRIDILVSTSVVEVGVDVPNASVMIIEGADRFGLAQLHQFRGRVGRSIHQSYCFLFADSQAEPTLARLKALVDCSSGFELAKLDLKFRGPGEFYGTAQKGFPELKMASLFDYALMKQARYWAVKLVSEDAGLNKWPALKEKLGEWEKSVHLE
ncbi:MAG: helicase-related protein, partial [Patescibacteria group bacterium]